jgi:hypothetical protein
MLTRGGAFALPRLRCAADAGQRIGDLNESNLLVKH